MRPLSVHPMRCMQLVEKAFNRKLKEATIIQVHKHTLTNLTIFRPSFFFFISLLSEYAREPIVTESTVANFRIEKYNEINETAPAPKTTNCQWDLHDGGGGVCSNAQRMGSRAAAPCQLCHYATVDRTRASVRSAQTTKGTDDTVECQ